MFFDLGTVIDTSPRRRGRAPKVKIKVNGLPGVVQNLRFFTHNAVGMQAGFNWWDVSSGHHQTFNKIQILAVIIWLFFLLVPDAQRQITAGNQCPTLQLGILLPVASIRCVVQLSKQRVYLVGLLLIAEPAQLTPDRYRRTAQKLKLTDAPARCPGGGVF